MKIKRIKKKYIVSGAMLVALFGAVGVGVYKANITRQISIRVT